MTRLHALFAITAGAWVLSGTALAAPLAPAAGKGPYEGPAFSDASTGTLLRRDVSADAAMHQPADGRFSAQGTPLAPSTLTRAQVHQSVLDAVAHGFRVGID